jgi:hypothetical protein
MHKALHPSLKHGLQYDGLDQSPGDYLEPLPDDQYSPQQRASKRRRVETIANRYLRGQAPLILTAHLRGPFNRIWENPWNGRAPTMQIEGKKADMPMGGRVKSSKNPVKTKKTKAKKGTTGVPRPSILDCNRDQPVVAPLKRSVNSHDVPRAEAYNKESIVPTTSLVLPEDETTVESQYFSANDEQRSLAGSSEKRSEWLRRRPLSPKEQEVLDKWVNNTSKNLSTPSKRGNREKEVNDILHLAPPRTPNWPDNDWKSSASASMIISPPISNHDIHLPPSGPLEIVIECAQQQQDSLHTEDLTETTLSAQSVTHGNLTNAPSVHLPTHPPVYDHRVVDSGVSREPEPPSSRLRSSTSKLQPSSPNAQPQTPAPTVLDCIQSARRLSQMAIQQALSARKTDAGLSKADIQRFAKRCADTRPSPSSAKSSRLPAKRDESPEQSTFDYRKIGGGKTSKSAKKKPRHITFDSSPELQKTNDVSKNIDTSRARTRPDIYDVMADAPVIIEHEHDTTQDKVGGEHSQYSTQHAMMLAHMEFQEDVFPSPSSETPGPRADKTDTPGMQQTRRLSPVITPFSVFNTRLDETEMPGLDDEPYGPLPSTQDLFENASPFAFSTVKKNIRVPKQSGLRFTVLQNAHVERADAGVNDRRSPTPSGDRVPLKERNGLFRAITNGSDKSSQEEAPATSQDARSNVFDSPGFNFGASLDGGVSVT